MWKWERQAVLLKFYLSIFKKNKLKVLGQVIDKIVNILFFYAPGLRFP